MPVESIAAGYRVSSLRKTNVLRCSREDIAHNCGSRAFRIKIDDPREKKRIARRRFARDEDHERLLTLLEKAGLPA
jgi:hypothetical protein